MPNPPTRTKQTRQKTYNIKKPLRILLADDHALVRAGLRKLLEQIPAVEIVGEAANGLEACRLARSLNPDLVLMDISMTVLNGVEATAQLLKSSDAQVLILSMYANSDYVQRALKAGARGYLLKEATNTELELAIESVRKGKIYLSPAVVTDVLDECLDYLGQTSKQEGGELEVLTPRQRQILQLIVEGNTNSDIADLLHLSIKTVEAHRSELMHRLDIHDVPSLVRYAMRMGIIPPERPIDEPAA
ncbi:response regulator [Nitrococcus mobilis]|uniref:DNA-binding response regulator, LuxR family protein n=1 Tax=Nitrococcus mobilis Nb-231 TaxID=314278 RepID=A4BQP2_9GAMM|nr:response regulator transcription factor [Nitrococcus mobilis]EAR21892.1 DNA-binding response regulator, LuxR family protein [Nitrococcus mobilis Nb-231]